jgi:hypothetical protein
MRHSNRRGHDPYTPNQSYPEPSRLREIRDNRNRFMNDSDDYYGRYNRFETIAYDRDEWDDQDHNQFGEREFEFEEKRNQSNYFDQGQRFPNRRGAMDQNGNHFERDRRFLPERGRGYGTDRAVEPPYDPSTGYGNEWQRDGRFSTYPNHRGKGPKGYTRSPERIKEDIYDKLHDDYLLDASNIEIDIKKDEVVLSGTVTDRHSKRRAEEDVEAISGVRNVENRIRVKQSNDDENSTQGINRNNGNKGKQQ